MVRGTEVGLARRVTSDLAADWEMTMLLLALAALNTLATRTAPMSIRCDNGTTVQIDNCLAREAGLADADLEKYREAARKRLQANQGVSPPGNGVAQAPTDFDKAEKAWAAYRAAECAAVFDNWREGTIRTAMETTCDIRLTRLHTHTIWREWLTFMDNAPPLLPEPPVSAQP